MCEHPRFIVASSETESLLSVLDRKPACLSRNWGGGISSFFSPFSRSALSVMSALGAVVLLATPGGAQTGSPQTGGTQVPPPPDLSLIHLDTPILVGKGGVGANLQVRVFGGDEDLVYTSIGVQYGFGNNWSGLLRGTFAGRENFSLPGGTSAIRHGGSDIELAAKYQLPNNGRFAGLIGVSFPGTAAQNDPVITLGASAAFPLGSRATACINPKTVLLQDNLLLGVGIGVQAQVSEAISVLADFTPLLSGDNTRSTDNGRRERRTVYGIAVRIARPESPLSFDIGFANGTGRTTGASLTPGLGGTGGLYVGLTLRQ